MTIATRSLWLPSRVEYSHFTKMSLSTPSVTRFSFTIGVCPTALVMSLCAPRIMICAALSQARPPEQCLWFSWKAALLFRTLMLGGAKWSVLALVLGCSPGSASSSGETRAAVREQPEQVGAVPAEATCPAPA